MKTIALTSTQGNDMDFTHPRYMKFLLDAADQLGVEILPVLLPNTDYKTSLIPIYARQFDGFLFTGGNDVDPSYYGEERHEKCGDSEPSRDIFEMGLLRELIALDKPTFGICRGCQSLAVAAGATLVQDIPSEVENQIGHMATHHSIAVSGWVADVAGSAEIHTNSFHHQCVKDPGPNLTVCGYAPDGIIEAFDHKALSYYRATQWHPEMSRDDLSFALIRDFVRYVCR